VSAEVDPDLEVTEIPRLEEPRLALRDRRDPGPLERLAREACGSEASSSPSSPWARRCTR
jgi:hypothetical protein